MFVKKREIGLIVMFILMVLLLSLQGGCRHQAGTTAVEASKKKVKFVTYGQPDDWANWKEMFKAFNKKHGCIHEDTDMSSAEEIEKFKAEKNNPIADTTDIGIMWGPVAVKEGVTLAYKNNNWDKLGIWAKEKDGNFCGSYLGVPVFMVNTDVVKTVPKSWNDLLRTEYKDMICIKNPQITGIGQNMVLAVAYALGGDITNLDKSMKYFAKLYKKGNIKNIDISPAAIQKGEIPIMIIYDFLAKQYQENLKGKINFKVIFPKEGSIWAPSALIINKFAPHKKLAKAFSNFIMSDEGQLIFAKGYAYPIRAVEGNLTIPEDIKNKMLPEDFYKNCGKPNNWDNVSPGVIASRWAKEVLEQ
jgi:putative spermidine/putrescine transport system substrate-binding protein